LACGSGRLTFPLVEAGFTVDAVDNAKGMLNRLNLKLESASADVKDRAKIICADMSKRNKKAWSHKTLEAWQKLNGSPEDMAKEILKDPRKILWRTIDHLGDVKSKRVINLLGSHGKKAVSLALLGAEVTVVDISEKNKEYAMAAAEVAGVKITYIVSDVLSLNLEGLKSSYNIVLTELGILHYFLDLNPFFKVTYDLLRGGGKLVLNEGHPIKKCIKMDDVEKPYLDGNYFDSGIIENSVAYEFIFGEVERRHSPKCFLRRWTLGEVITAVAEEGFVIKKLVEDPGPYRHIPAYFTLVSEKRKETGK
jgi:2-polyprenyl-3-methyl-5-hydroxy-6-metoxy-1,4-benzoquinol methylase